MIVFIKSYDWHGKVWADIDQKAFKYLDNINKPYLILNHKEWLYRFFELRYTLGRTNKKILADSIQINKRGG